MTEPGAPPMDYPDKPPPYSPPGEAVYQSGYGQQPQQPHIFTAAPPQGIPVGSNVPMPNYGTGFPVYGASTQTQIIVVGGCPACRIGVLEDEFTCCGICLGIVLFPLGLLCCLAMRQRRCPNCGAIFG